MGGRERLLGAAFGLLVERGPSFATEEVVREAAVSKGLLFHHFGSREGLLDAMAAQVLAETQEGLARLVLDYPNPRERLFALARTLLEPPEDPAAARRVLLFWLADDAAGRPRAALRDTLLADFIAQTLREGAATGATRAGLDPVPVAHRLLARWHGATALAGAGSPVDFDREADALVAELEGLVRRES